MSRHIEFFTELPAPAAAAFAWHARPSAFERLAPPWDPPRLRRPAPAIAADALVRFEVGPRLAPVTWEAEITDVEPGKHFVDIQRRGPFAAWRHEHLFEDLGPGRSALRDRLQVSMPLAPIGNLGWPIVTRQLERLFSWRHFTTTADLALHQACALPSSTIAVTGAGGFLGAAVCELLETGGHRVLRLARATSPPATGLQPCWIPGSDRLPHPELLEGCDALVHLAGEGIADGSWTPARKHRILSSRSTTTAALIEAFGALSSPPRTVIVASAVGYYGNRPSDEVLDENSAGGDGFLAEVVAAWEEAAATADPWARRVSLRFGVVLDPRGGALAKMLPAFAAGVGGPIGGGRQMFPWVTRDDAAAAVVWALASEQLRGPVNVVAPDPRSQAEVARSLGRVLRRPAVVPLPRAAVSLLFGEMGRETLLAGQRVHPAKLVDSGFPFRAPDLDEALARLLGRPRARPA